MKRRPCLILWKPRDFGEVFNLNWRIPDKFWMISTNHALTTLTSAHGTPQIYHQHGLSSACFSMWTPQIIHFHYTCYIQRRLRWPSSHQGAGSRLASALRMKLWWRNFLAPGSVWKPRDFGEALNINWRIPDMFSPQMILPASNSQIGRVPSHEAFKSCDTVPRSSEHSLTTLVPPCKKIGSFNWDRCHCCQHQNRQKYLDCRSTSAEPGFEACRHVCQTGGHLRRWRQVFGFCQEIAFLLLKRLLFPETMLNRIQLHPQIQCWVEQSCTARTVGKDHEIKHSSCFFLLNM